MLIRMDGETTWVESVTSSVQLGATSQGLVVWSHGRNEGWAFIPAGGHWTFPSMDEVERRRPMAAESRGDGPCLSIDRDSSAALMLVLDPLCGQDSRRPTTRVFVTPAAGALVVPRPTLRRQGPHLGELDVSLRNESGEVMRWKFRSGQQSLAWSEVSGLPPSLRGGLTAGRYLLRPEGGGESFEFAVVTPRVRKKVLRHAERLGQLLGDPRQPLVVQVTAESLLTRRDADGHPEPDPGGALDVLEEAGGEHAETAALRNLYSSLRQRLFRPGRDSGHIANPEETGIPWIDAARGELRRRRWAEAEQFLAEAARARDPRTKSLTAHDHGVLRAESSMAPRDEVETDFQSVIEQFATSRPDDHFRAHLRYGNDLLDRAIEHLHNQALRMAAGVHGPILESLRCWSAAWEQLTAARDLSEAYHLPGRKAVLVDLARSQILLADLIRTIDVEHHLDAGERSALRSARELAERAIADQDLQILAMAHEVLAETAYREGRDQDCRSLSNQALHAYQEIGSLAGVEGIHRMLGLLEMRADHDSTKAVKHFLISHELSEVLFERLLPDRVGLTRARFFARRTFVNEKLVDILAAGGRLVEALDLAESAKARAMEDLLQARDLHGRVGRGTTRSVAEILSDWPENTAALEYFFGPEKGWLFLIDPAGRPSIRVLADPDTGESIIPRDLILRVKRLLDELGAEKARMASRGYDPGWQSDFHALRRILVPDAIIDPLRSARTVVVVPHHLLHYVPFAALVVTEDETRRGPNQMPRPRFLIDEPYTLVNTPSLKSWDLLRRQPRRPLDQVRALGIESLPGAAPLPGVGRELGDLVEAFGGRVQSVFTGKAATVDRALSALRHPGLVVLSTHGVNLPERPLDSYLQMYPDAHQGNGGLTAAALYGAHVGADLVVLSACYSGRAGRSPMAGDDLFSLPWALLQSGAGGVVASLWESDDLAGPELCALLYRRLAKGSSAPDALASAQREFLASLRSGLDPDPWLHPFFWAEYAVWGADQTFPKCSRGPAVNRAGERAVETRSQREAYPQGY